MKTHHVATSGGAILLATLVAAAIIGPSGAEGATPAPTSTAPASSGTSVTVVIPATNTGGNSGGTSGGSSGSSGGAGTGTAGGGLTTESFGKPTPPASPTSGAGKLTLDHDTITAKEWMTATGTGFTPGENVQFVYYPGAVVIGSFVADGKGKVEARFRIPDDMRPGVHTLEATGWTSKHVLNKEFTVTTAAAGAFPYLWWVWVVLGVLVLGLLSLAIYFRRSIADWFGARDQPTGAPS